MLLPPWIAALSLMLIPLAPHDGSQTAALCEGCQGTGGSGVASGGTCTGAVVSVSVTIIGGECSWTYDSPSSSADCRQRRQCNVTVERSWSNLPASTPIDICLTLEPGGTLLCLGKSSHTSGSTGSGSDVRTGPDMDCGSGPRTYFLSSAACGLTATGSASCSPCNLREG
jgi:hypothetical protein